MGVMGVMESAVRTNLSVKECGRGCQGAAVPAQGLASKASGMIVRMRGGKSITFYTRSDDPPFTSLGDDKPAFAVGVHIPRFAGGAKRETTNIQMHVYGRGSHREATLISEHSLADGGHAGQLIGKIGESFGAVDPCASDPAGLTDANRRSP